jgi:hypothetical protein
LNENLSDAEVDATWIIATSRFEATNVAIWADSPNIKYDLFRPGSVLGPELIPAGSQYILATGELSADGDFEEIIVGDGYVLYKLK